MDSERARRTQRRRSETQETRITTPVRRNEESIQWKIQLTSPACTEVGEKVALSRRIEEHWRLVGWGSVQRGTVLEVD
ncbi:hypothetical protein DFP72DRAFT_535681 [Ephemerocybe angulata]|uniref:Initiation factor eIF2 gamma C-terminal domain-containing protein n=1 Tax=Ephemerocybe angulata TaxID=980116 RepID=A0A8H6HME7_9AGAR|nr:hypothetical protein DFP72DRAFT_535681 [Tulosesus angulatus]